MTGLPNFNYDAFFAARETLTARGYEAVSPTESTNDVIVTEAEAQPWDFYMRLAIPLLLTCDAIHLLDGWEKSRGARLERYIAVELRMEVIQ
jgi:hypothetical protein